MTKPIIADPYTEQFDTAHAHRMRQMRAIRERLIAGYRETIRQATWAIEHGDPVLVPFQVVRLEMHLEWLARDTAQMGETQR